MFDILCKDTNIRRTICIRYTFNQRTLCISEGRVQGSRVVMLGLIIRKPRQWLQTLAGVLLVGCFNGRPYCVGILLFIEELSIFFERSKKTKQKKIAG